MLPADDSLGVFQPTLFSAPDKLSSRSKLFTLELLNRGTPKVLGELACQGKT